MGYSAQKPADKNPDRFWNKVEVRAAADCWEWTASKDMKGYGKLWWGKSCLGAHRISWMLFHGTDRVPDKLLGSRAEIMHTCDNPGCVNPAHLVLGNTVQNQRDKVSKGRHHFHTRLTCNNGHPWTPENTGWIRGLHSDYDGTEFRVRYCRACKRKDSKKLYDTRWKAIRKTRKYKDETNARRRKLYAQKNPDAKLRGPYKPRRKSK